MHGGRGPGGATRSLLIPAAAIAAAVAVGSAIVYVHVSDSPKRARPVRREPRAPGSESGTAETEAEPVADAPQDGRRAEVEPALAPEVEFGPAVTRLKLPWRRPRGRKETIPGLYGEAGKEPTRHLPSAVDKSVLRTKPWEKKPFFYVQTALHPGLFMRAKSDRLVLFSRLGEWGLGQPSFYVVRTAAGAKGFRGAGLDGSEMTAPWIITSFAGSEGWSEWDSPWLIVLLNLPQHSR